MTNHSTTSKNPFDIFIVGLRKGLDIGLYSLLPNVLMAFVLTYMPVSYTHLTLPTKLEV